MASLSAGRLSLCDLARGRIGSFNEMTMAFALTCWHCDWEGPESGPLAACPACGGVLEFSSQNVLDRDVPHRVGRVSDFDSLMPIVESTANHPEFDLPYTPLVHAAVLSEQLGITLFIKDEMGLPTGSWKDREAYVFFDRLRRHGITDIVLFSAGNTGAALARAAGILRWSRLHLVVPSSSRERIRSLPHSFTTTTSRSSSMTARTTSASPMPATMPIATASLGRAVSRTMCGARGSRRWAWR